MPDASPPLISVVLTSHNRAQYLPESIESILNQSCSDFELLIVDDASDDPGPDAVGPVEITRQYAARDNRIRPIHLTNNLGLGGARNRGVSEARGTYIAFQDDDDVSLPQRLEKQLNFLREHPQYALVGGRKAVCDAQLRVQHIGPPDHLYRQPVAPPLDGIFRPRAANADPAALIRRDCLLEAKGYRTWFKLLEDWDLTLRLQEKYPLASLPETVLYYRMHSADQMTRSPLLWHYTLAAFVCAVRRRAGAAEPIGATVDARSLVPLLGELPASLQAELLDIHYRNLRDLLRQGQLQQALDALDDLLVAQVLVTPEAQASLKPSVGSALRLLRQRLSDRKALLRLDSIRRKMLWLCLRHREAGYWLARRPEMDR